MRFIFTFEDSFGRVAQYCCWQNFINSATRICTKLKACTYREPMLLLPQQEDGFSTHCSPKRLPSASASKNDENARMISNTYRITGTLSAIAWITTAYDALSFHPDPKFADCSLRHNLLTMSQAFAFPLPVGWASFHALSNSALDCTLGSTTSQRLNTGIAVASFWLAASVAYPPMFAFGYDLYSYRHKIIAATIHAMTGIFALKMTSMSINIVQFVRGILDSLWKFGPDFNSGLAHRNSSAYATGSLGLLYFTIQPIVSPFPLATIPTILGKRLSRPASAFNLLGSIVAYCLKDKITHGSELTNGIKISEEKSNRNILRNGLAFGSAAHLFLILLKIIGMDGGGLIFPGRGLWEVYPAMISVPFAAGVSIIMHAILCFAGATEEDALK
jgi:hypothetical protein